jgi:GNAT superfamily N-acetyltransferase
VDYIYVPESYRGTGIGKKLITEIFSRLKPGEGIAAISNSEHSQEFFLHIGFRKAKVYQDPMCRALMLP